MKKLAVLFGGKSPEYEVSLVSASYVIALCRSLQEYDVLPVGISRQGEFFEYQGPLDRIPQDLWREDADKLKPIYFKPGSLAGYYRQEAGDRLTAVPLDLVFPVLHGADGEGGPLQGFLETVGLAYVGCRPLAASLMMDKVAANTIFAAAGLPKTPGISFTQRAYQEDAEACLAKIDQAGLAYPLFVKPPRAGSSVGISRVTRASQVPAAVSEAFRYDSACLIEEGVEGRELEVAVLEQADGRLLVSRPGEIIAGNDFYDYQAKYAKDSSSQLQIPAPLSPKQESEIREMAARAFRAGTCRGLARVDFFLRSRDQAFLINEINTMPGFTPISMFPKLMLASGLTEETMIRHLLASGRLA